MHLRDLTALVLVLLASVGVRAQQETVYSPGDGVSLPRVVRQVQPEYTNEARAQQIQGDVVLSCVVRANGHVTDIAVRQSLDAVYGLDKQAVEALKQWEFKAGVRNNQPVAVKVEIKMTFALK